MLTKMEIDTAEAVRTIEQIRLVHVEAPLVETKFLFKEYPGAERDLCLYVVQGFYNEIVQKSPGGLEPRAKLRALSMAKWFATRRITTELKGLVERSTLFMLVDAEETKWYNDMEYSDMEDLLASIYEGKEGRDEAYDWKFIVSTLLPLAHQAGIPATKIISASLHVKKLRGSVPAMRELLERQDKQIVSPEETKVTLDNWLSEIANPAISYEAFHENVEEWRGKNIKRDSPITGYRMMTPDGRFWLVVPTESDKDMAVVEQALKNRVDLKLTGVDWLFSRVLGMMKVKPK